jgi:hypothetical protein
LALRQPRQKEVRIMGSKSVLLRTLVATSSAKTAGFGVPSFVPKWSGVAGLEPVIVGLEDGKLYL